MPPTAVHTPVLERLTAAAVAIEEAADALALKRAHRNQLVREAMNDGISYRTVAKAAKVSPGAVGKILGTPDDDDDQGEGQ